jgi:small subunit ribosomal protein S20
LRIGLERRKSSDFGASLRSGAGWYDYGFGEDTNYVASHASALKAHRQSLKNREHNRQFRARLRNALKSIRAAINGNDLSAARASLKQTISLIDRMASKGIIHKNAAGRYKSRLTTRLAKSKAA